ncbi:AAA family ATPase [Burkholderia sp. PU8-34]
MSGTRRVPFALRGGKARRDALRVDRALRRAVTYPHPAGRIRRIETHLSVVYLAGRYAYKIVKPVKFGFVDLTRLAQRRRCAQAECTLNRPFAAPLYLDVWPVVAHGRRCTFGSALREHRHMRQSGDDPLEYVVRMRRFDAHAVLDVLPFYMVYRALVRALAARLRGDAVDRARYLRVATAIAARARDAQPCLLLCHGVSGSGKSVASRALAVRLGAIRLSSDAARKRLAGQAEEARLPASAYSVAAIDGIYERLLVHVQTVLESGHTAIVDATFLRERNRAAFISLAHRLGLQVIILDFVANPSTLLARVSARAALGCDASDADTTVLASQLEQAEPLTAAERALAIRFDTTIEPAAYDGEAFWRPLLARLARAATEVHARDN